MTIPKTSRTITKNSSPAFRVLESFLLIICMAVLALRSTYIESPGTETVNSFQVLSNAGFSLIFSSTLLFTAAIWLIASLLRRRATWRLTGIETGLVLLTTAAFIGIGIASNKRAAITDTVTLITPVIMAILLTQILNSQARIKLVLIVVIALGAVATSQCIDQLLTSNEETVKAYEADPQTYLRNMGITQGSFQHMLFEHRIYSKDIRGYLTTSNSTGSFLILATFAAIGMAIEQVKQFRRDHSPAPLFAFTAVAIFLTTGLIVTQSKGAITAAAIAAVALVLALTIGGFLRKYRKPILVAAILMGAVAVAAVVSYGRKHDRLPGGNSMLVRWQYWASSAQMYADHPLTGVGGANFGSYYPRYKVPAAPETISDPHNFILSLICQYGPLGLIGFVIAMAIPLARVIFTAGPTSPPGPDQPTTAAPPGSPARGFMNIAPPAWALVLISLAMLLVRPLLIAPEPSDILIVKFSVILVLYAIPVFIFIIIFSMLFVAAAKNPQPAPVIGPATTTAIVCGIIGVIIANTIDYAIFEPAVLTLLWTMLACAIAIDAPRTERPSDTLRLRASIFQKLLALSAVIAIVTMHCNVVLIPPIKAGAKIQQSFREPLKSHRLLGQAAQDDPFDPDGFSLNGKLCLMASQAGQKPQLDMLKLSANYFEEAAAADPAGFKDYENLSNVYALLTKHDTTADQPKWAQLAFEYAEKAAQRYPGSARLQMQMATIADQRGKSSIAIEHYKRAVQIEQSYQKQFEQMYPNKQTFSRLGWDKYRFVKRRYRELTGERL